MSQSDVKKAGSISNKDITVAMSAEDWETKYKEICAKYEQEGELTEVLKKRLVTK